MELRYAREVAVEAYDTLEALINSLEDKTYGWAPRGEEYNDAVEFLHKKDATIESWRDPNYGRLFCEQDPSLLPDDIPTPVRKIILGINNIRKRVEELELSLCAADSGVRAICSSWPDGSFLNIRSLCTSSAVNDVARLATHIIRNAALVDVELPIVAANGEEVR